MSFLPRADSVPSESALKDIISGIFSDDAQTRQEYLSIIGLLYQAGINLGIGAGAFLLFLFMRPNNQRVYARRYKALVNDERRPPKISKGIFAWVPVLWRADERFLLDTVDIDSVFFLRFMKLGMWLMAIFGFLGMCIIVPLNFTNGNNANVTGNISEFTLLWITLFHISEKLSVLSLHAVAAYVFTAIFFYFIIREYKHFIRVKQEYFASPKYLRKLQSRTLMVTRVPVEQQSDTALNHFVSSASAGIVPTQVSVARKIGELQEMVDKHEQVVRKLEKVLAKYLAGDYQSKPRPKIKVSGAQVDAIEHYTLEIESLEATINQARKETETFTATSVGFVSYSSPQLAHEALRSLKHLRPALATMAPHPRDIIWSNAQMPKSKRIGRLWTARLISVVICFIAFWPVAALTFIASAANIQVLWPETTSFFTRHSTLTTIWQNTFSPLILTIYYICIPHIFRAISRYQGISTHTGVERSVLKNMYVFYILSNLVVLTLVGVIVSAVLDKTSFKETMSSFAHNYVQSLNQKAQFWTAYVSIKVLNAMLEFAQLISLAMIFFKRYTRDLTPRELSDLTKPPDLDYSPVYSLYLWVFTISMFYSVYSPIVLPFAFLDYVLAYWVYKYAVMYVYQTRHDTAGAMWRNVINRMITSMVIFQVYLICCLKVRMDMFDDRLQEVARSMPIVYCLIPLPVMTTALGIYLHFWMNPKVNYMNSVVGIEEMADMRKVAEEDANAEDTLGDRFLHPTFSKPLATPMVDRRIKHLLPRVYRGRLSISGPPGGTVRKGMHGEVDSRFGTSIGNASTLFGSHVMDTDSMVDARDRRDFDGTSTPVPFKHSSSGATTVNGKGLSRSYSVDSNTSHGDDVEMMRLGNMGRGRGDSASSSQADLLGHAQGISGHMADVSDHDMGLTRSTSSVNRFNSGSSRIAPGRDFDPIDLYDDRSNNTSMGDMYLDAYSPRTADLNSPAGSAAMAMTPMQHQNYHQRPAMRPPIASSQSFGGSNSNSGFSGSMRGTPSPDYFASGSNRPPNAPAGMAGPPRPRQGFGAGTGQQNNPPRPQQMGSGPRPQQFNQSQPQQFGSVRPPPQQQMGPGPRPPLSQPQPPSSGPQRNIPRWD
ncbi:hypothetical protein FB645_006097 [Coemansia sp. IMI 203386]|nr:hypothetical protein FB645_006097 [Coemansia sp. IMI 203386]